MLALAALRQALQTLRAHRLRATLTLFGVVWGTASVIFLVGWGEGVRVMLERGFFKAGKNMGEVWAGRMGEDFTPAVDRRYLWFTAEDVEVLRRRARHVELVGSEAWQIVAGTHGARALTVDLRGMDPEAVEVRGVPLAAGRRLHQGDVDHRRRVVVLGDHVRRVLLGAEGGLGSWVRLDGRPFQVVGLLAPVGTQLSQDRMEIDKQAWAPITTVQTHWPRWWTDQAVVNKIVYRMTDRHAFEASEREVRAILADRLGVPASDDEAVGIYSSVVTLSRIPLDETRGFLFVLAATTLVVGGIGVLAMMLDAVHERRQEIGVRLAIGARPRDVLLQFFVETLAITLLGGVLGVALGVAGCWALGRLEVPDLVPVPVLQPGVVVVAALVMTGVGVVAGLLPAWRAARIDPAVTLRME